VTELSRHFRNQMAVNLTREMRHARQRGADIGTVEGCRVAGWQPASPIPADTTGLSRQQRRAAERRQAKEQRSA
jgi:hypothetical protein